MYQVYVAHLLISLDAHILNILFLPNHPTLFLDFYYYKMFLFVQPSEAYHPSILFRFLSPTSFFFFHKATHLINLSVALLFFPLNQYPISIDQIIKQAGIKFGTKFTTAMVKKIPGTVLTKINQKVGFRFLTKFGEKGIINIAKLVPVVGGVIGGGFDLVETKVIANRAYKMFINGDFSVLNDKDDKKTIETNIDIVDITEK